MWKTFGRLLVVLVSVTMVAAACSSDDGDADSGGGGGSGSDPAPADIDYEAIGLWDDGPCDEAAAPLHIGLMTTFESPVISLEDQALALEAAAEAFNARGGANGSCIQVTTCDDKANPEAAVGCVRTIADAGVVVTVNDQGLAAQGDVAEAMVAAGIPRMAGNVAPQDWNDPNSYPIDASGTGVTFLLPQALIDAGKTEIAAIRVGQAEASALIGILEDIYEGDATFTEDIPVPAGTTDFSQFILSAQESGATGATLAVGEQEAVQIVKAGEQLGSDLTLGSSLGTFSHNNIAELGDYAEQMVFAWSFAPPTADLPVYDAMRADLAASGEESLEAVNLKASPVRSWIGLYALLKMIRDADMTEFTSDGIRTMLDAATDVPMLDMFGGDNWTPNESHPGLFSRAGIDRWATYNWDPDAEGEFDGNFVEASELSFDEVLCGSPFGAPADSC
ncbi:MAG: ABC transporter substrate-binding protein [Actinomycetota bacterium]|nr:ABC transporter substrate-binding protein [Actinomycetota bacterium]